MWTALRATDRPIVVGIDGRPDSENALRWAVTAARLHRVPLRVVLVADAPEVQRYVPYQPTRDGETFLLPANPGRHPSDDDLDRALSIARLQLRPESVSGRRAPGSAATALIEDAADAAMLVVGTRRRGPVAAAALGSVSATVAAHARCPVIVVGTEPAAGSDGLPIVVGIADDRAADGVLDFAFREAAARGVPLVVLHAGRPDLGEPRHPDAHFGGMVPRLAARLANYAARHPGVQVASHLSAAGPGADLAAASATAQLVVVGSRGRGRVSGLVLGSVGQHLLHEARCPVAVVHPGHARTPQRATTRSASGTPS
ncbi:universal stress protein [Jiangella mangrovi]|uniref:Nucleotide-binding universal stress UspA family protein n=1 Tax=Jiangella mangrovi TaxID=1524084 RepID=A0A7W9GS13_9ACTN|nr:universal stress protein [Jiangella mangrovi]MBB5788768.1 nucleotide-binding universal stress UspA family protein [Jiangella mangrovi]